MQVMLLLFLCCCSALISHSYGDDAAFRQANVNVENTGPTHIFMEGMSSLNFRTDVVKGRRMHLDYVHEVIFVIKQKNMDELSTILDDLSDPYSPNYGQHWTRERVADFTVNPESHDITVTHLKSFGAVVTSDSLSGEFVTAKASIAVWETMLNTRFHTFYQTKWDKSVTQVVRATEYYIPIALHSHVEGALNTIEMPIMSRRGTKQSSKSLRKRSLAEADEPFNLTPPKFLAYYNMTGVRGSNFSTQAVYEPTNQYYSPTDLSTFQARYGITPHPLDFDIGGHLNARLCDEMTVSCTEGNADLQYMTSISQGSPTTIWVSPFPFSYFLSLVGRSKNRPLVISFSYGFDEPSVGATELWAFNTQAIKLGIIGTTIVAGAGDDGASSPFGCGYIPLFPASSPYVVTVGATEVSSYMLNIIRNILQWHKSFLTIH